MNNFKTYLIVAIVCLFNQVCIAEKVSPAKWQKIDLTGMPMTLEMLEPVLEKTDSLGSKLYCSEYEGTSFQVACYGAKTIGNCGVKSKFVRLLLLERTNRLCLLSIG